MVAQINPSHHIIAAIRELERQVTECRQMLTRLSDDFAAYGPPNQQPIVLTINQGGVPHRPSSDSDSDTSSSDESDSDHSVKSAPATVSYDMI